MLPLNSLVARFVAKIRRETLKITGERIKVINEILQGIRIIKFYAWENSFLEKISKLRINELSQIRKSQYIQNIVSSITAIAPLIVSVGTFLIYSLMGYPLDAAIIFPALRFVICFFT